MLLNYGRKFLPVIHSKFNNPRYFNISADHKNEESVKREPVVDLKVRFIYPEFLPDPKAEWRNPIREKLERADMLKRRSRITIPEFYVGSILAVTKSNVHAPTKVSRFLGICILKQGCGLRAEFMLRNVIDNLGIDIIYRLYDPTILKIEVIRLEKRLDDNLLYLRDSLPEYSTFPQDMEPEFLAEGEEVPVNPIKVKLKPPPWRGRPEIKRWKGVADFSHYVSKQRASLAERAIAKSFVEVNKWDLMKDYRKYIPEEEQREIFTEVYSELQKSEIKRKKMKRKQDFIPPTKTA